MPDQSPASTELPARPAAPSISIVIAVLNGAATLGRCLESIFEQTYPNLDVIVTDGGSTDGTVTILESAGSRIHYWDSQEDTGIYQAWNRALEHAKGEWLLFLGADDWLMGSDVIDKVVGALVAAEGRFRLVYAAVDVVTEDGAIDHSIGRPWATARQEIRRGMAIPHSATFHHRSLFTRCGGFDESFRIAGDYEFVLRELPEHDALFVPELVLVAKGARGVSDRPETRVLMVRENHRAKRLHGLTRTPEWLALIIIRTRFRGWLLRRFGPEVETSVTTAYRAAMRRRQD